MSTWRPLQKVSDNMLFLIIVRQGEIYDWALADIAQGDSNPFANIPVGVSCLEVAADCVDAFKSSN